MLTPTKVLQCGADSLRRQTVLTLPIVRSRHPHESD